jgi:hypothetical protein
MNEIYHWFDFDDSKVKSIKSSEIKKQFEGNESAYMLFYRRKTNNKKKETNMTELPEWLIDEVKLQNYTLNFNRNEKPGDKFEYFYQEFDWFDDDKTMIKKKIIMNRKNQ